jgi:hypothetical protein
MRQESVVRYGVRSDKENGTEAYISLPRDSLPIRVKQTETEPPATCGFPKNVVRQKVKEKTKYKTENNMDGCVCMPC